MKEMTGARRKHTKIYVISNIQFILIFERIIQNIFNNNSLLKLHIFIALSFFSPSSSPKRMYLIVWVRMLFAVKCRFFFHFSSPKSTSPRIPWAERGGRSGAGGARMPTFTMKNDVSVFQRNLLRKQII